MGRKKWVESASYAMGRIFTVSELGRMDLGRPWKNQVHSTQFDLSQFDLSHSTKRVDLILFDLFHSTHFMQSTSYYPNRPVTKQPTNYSFYSHYPSRPVEHSLKSCNDEGFKKINYVIKFFERISIAHSS